MPPNPRWVTWIYSSLVVYFKTQCVTINLPLFIPTEIRDPTISDFVEFRIDGPHFNELTSGYWEIDADIALLLTIVTNEANLYKLQNTAGLLLAMFDKDIPIFRYGGDDQTLFGCMRLQGSVIQTAYGQIQAATPVTQSSLEAHYHMEVCLTEAKLQG